MPEFALGSVELGLSGSFRKSFVDDQNYQESTSVTGSVSYYFWSLSALELSYTQGSALIVVQSSSDDKVTTTTSFEAFGLDLIFVLGGESSILNPYVKGGGAYIRKKIKRKPDNLQLYEVVDEKVEGVTPTAGLGVRLNLTEAFSLKLGFDVWWSPIGTKPMTTDYAGRAGVAWQF